MLMVTCPHSGETVPPEAAWLRGIPTDVLLTDVDRFVDELYAPACARLSVPIEVMDIHRYVLDLNRVPTDIDASIVEGAISGDATGGAAKFVSGFHWAQTTLGVRLLEKPLPMRLHRELVSKYYVPFHARVREMEKRVMRNTDALVAGGAVRFHLDVHSMPSVGKGAHKDAGQRRPDIVVSDCSGKSCAPEFKDRVITAFQAQGWDVAYNWPYLGGRMTEAYGDPANGRHSVQIELNRALYMDERTKLKLPAFDGVAEKIGRALERINQNPAQSGKT